MKENLKVFPVDHDLCSFADQPHGNAPAAGQQPVAGCQYWPGLTWTTAGSQEEGTIRQAEGIYRSQFQDRVSLLARTLKKERRIFLAMLFVHREEVLRAGLMDALLGDPARWRNKQAGDWRLNAFVRLMHTEELMEHYEVTYTADHLRQLGGALAHDYGDRPWGYCDTRTVVDFSRSHSHADMKRLAGSAARASAKAKLYSGTGGAAKGASAGGPSRPRQRKGPRPATVPPSRGAAPGAAPGSETSRPQSRSLANPPPSRARPGPALARPKATGRLNPFNDPTICVPRRTHEDYLKRVTAGWGLRKLVVYEDGRCIVVHTDQDGREVMVDEEATPTSWGRRVFFWLLRLFDLRLNGW